jgi:hypothetical protein
MKPNQYPDVSPCPSRWPSKHTRKEPAKSVFVSGVPVGSALGKLSEFGKIQSGRASLRAINARPAVCAETAETGLPAAEVGACNEGDVGHLGPRSPSIYEMYQPE